MGELDGRIAIVTGAARGIGSVVARTLALRGATVLIADREESAAAQMAEALSAEGLQAHSVVVDLSVGNAPRQLVEKAVKDYGALHILVNNARSGKRTGFLDEDPDTWRDTMAVTLDAAFFCIQAAVRVMRPEHHGSIINISSVSGFLASRESPAYHAAKAALLQLTRYCAAEAGNHGVRVNAVVPGFIVQDEHRTRYESGDNLEYRTRAELCHPLGAVGSSQDIADAVAFLSSDGSRFINGQAIVVDGGLTIQEQSTLVWKSASE